MAQSKQREWYAQWAMLQDNELFLFQAWIYPLTLDELRGKDVLECGCGGGQHTAFMAPYARTITAIDLNTIEIARERNRQFDHIRFMEADIATIDLGQQFDVVMSIGVVHHTDNPDRTVANLIRHVKPGGLLVLWVYSKEGNFLVEYGVEPIRKFFLRQLPRSKLLHLSRFITALLMPVVFSVYLLPMPFLPYYMYFQNFRRLSFSRNVLNVFDKLNSPQVQFIERTRVERWFDPEQFGDIHISSYCGVSWRCSGRRK
jgi:SAM-dependent methyltransferase